MKLSSDYGIDSIHNGSESKDKSEVGVSPLRPMARLQIPEMRRIQNRNSNVRANEHSVDMNSEVDSQGWRRSPSNRLSHSNSRYVLDINKKDFSRFNPKNNQSVVMNSNARRNMLNWVQPEIILVGCLVKINQHFINVKQHTFDNIKVSRLNTSDKKITMDNDTSTESTTNSRKFEKKAVMGLYFSLDLVTKRWIRYLFEVIKEYRHQKALDTFEFQISYFNKFTQTYIHHFNPDSVCIQKDDPGREELRGPKLQNMLDWFEHKTYLYTKGSFISIIRSSENSQIDEVHQKVQEIQRKINRKLEWRSINERNKIDAEKKFFLSFLVNIFERKSQEHTDISFQLIEKHTYIPHIKQIALKNIVNLTLRVVSKEFHRYRIGCYIKKQELTYDQIDQLKALSILNRVLHQPIKRMMTQTVAKIRLEFKLRSRRSIIGITRQSYKEGSVVHKKSISI